VWTSRVCHADRGPVSSGSVATIVNPVVVRMTPLTDELS
jgi:hypothetical protein